MWIEHSIKLMKKDKARLKEVAAQKRHIQTLRQHRKVANKKLVQKVKGLIFI